MSRSAVQQYRTRSKNKPSCHGSRNGKPSRREIENDVLRTVRQFGSEVSQSMKKRAAGLREKAEDCLTQGRKKARSLERKVERRIEQRPLSTLLAAAGMGMLIGVLAARRR